MPISTNTDHSGLQWSEQFSVGIPEIDEQHKTLFDLINKIHTAILERRGSAACAEVLDELVSYTRVHFGLEQNLMRSGKFPGYAAHCALHHSLVAEVESMQSKIRSGKAAISFELLHFLRNWLTGHILTEDMKYAAFFSGATEEIEMPGVRTPNVLSRIRAAWKQLIARRHR